SPYQPYPQLISSAVGQSNEFGGLSLLPYSSDPTAITQSTYQCHEEPVVWPLSAEYGQCRSLTTTEDDEDVVEGQDVVDGQLYARLIHKALMEAPGHRMMLPEIYEWFRHNAAKPRGSRSNGWQSSIRHNRSMNEAFENDRDNAKGNSRQATSVWVLTNEARSRMGCNLPPDIARLKRRKSP
ncbi:uncharacterized protein PV07_12703, partial [Cladophialophora immunda]